MMMKPSLFTNFKLLTQINIKIIFKLTKYLIN